MNSAATLGVSAIGNPTTRNTLSGIALGTKGLLSRNISAGNVGGFFFGGTSLGDNLCNGALC